MIVARGHGSITPRPAGRAGQLLRRSLPWASDWSTTTSSDRSTLVPSNPVYNQRPDKRVCQQLAPAPPSGARASYERSVPPSGSVFFLNKRIEYQKTVVRVPYKWCQEWDSTTEAPRGADKNGDSTRAPCDGG